MICYRLFDAKFKDSELFKRKKRKNLLSHFEEDYYKKTGLNLLYQLSSIFSLFLYIFLTGL